MSLLKSKKWLDMEKFMFHEDKLVEASREVDQLTKLLGLTEGSHILDLPCGIGRHAILLAKLGYSVTGVDITSDFLVQARLKAKADNVFVRLLHGDMKTFNDGILYDAIINLYTSFGYFEHREDDFSVLCNFNSLIKPQGKLVMDLMSREIFLNRFHGRTEKKLNDGSVESFEYVMRPDSWMECKWVRATGNRLHTAQSGIRLYSSDELQALLLKAGFSNIETFGGLDRSRYDADSSHLVVVASK